MTIKVEMVTVDCRDTYALADWWSRQTGGKVVGERGDEFVMVEPGAGAARRSASNRSANRRRAQLACETQNWLPSGSDSTTQVKPGVSCRSRSTGVRVTPAA